MKSALGNYFIHIVFFCCLELYFSGSHLIFSSKPNGLVYKVPPSVNFRKLSINVPLFGCVCVNGPKFIRRIEDRQGSSQYLQMLRELPSGGHYGFAQNHHPAHRSRLVKDWISSQSHLTLLPWPNNSPDLMPISRFWTRLIIELNEEKTIEKKTLMNCGKLLSNAGLNVQLPKILHLSCIMKFGKFLGS